jgi:hypothetical protein
MVDQRVPGKYTRKKQVAWMRGRWYGWRKATDRCAKQIQYRAEAINDDKDGDEALKRTKTDEQGDGGKRQSQCI